MGDRYDALVIGGGLAGLTFAYQLKKEMPDATVLVVDRHRHPVPEAAFKVGESTSEVAAFYLREVLGLGPHLESSQLRKFAIRFFLPAGRNDDIASRVEIGISDFFPSVTYQLDRGRFENYLFEACAAQGVELIDSASVESADIDRDGHLVVLGTEEGKRRVRARWLVDASGRRSFLKRKLDLHQRLDHDINAAWFRVGHRVDLGQWSEDSDYRNRVVGAKRWLSTNHLMGYGYWVWLIPLASGSTSIGVVTDPSIVPLADLSSMERVLAWLHQHEPQCAAAVEGLPVQDFRAMHTHAYTPKRSVSTDRWLLTGESAVFFDPLYSPGSDVIAIANTLLCWLLGKDLRGEDISDLTEIVNTTLNTMGEVALPFWRGAYPVMGDPQTFAYKLLWDNESYFSMIATPWTHTRWTDVNFLLEYLPLAVRFNVLSQQVQSTLRARARADSSAYEPRFIDAVGTYGEELNAQISRPMEAAEMIPLAEHNLQYLSVIAASITGNRNLGEGANAEVTALAQAEFEHTRLKPARSNIAIAT